MPTIQQERGVKTVKGLPRRWGVRAYRELSGVLRTEGAESDRYKSLAGLLDEVTAAPLPLDATDAHLCVLAERYAAECANAGLPMAADSWNWQEKRMEHVAMAAITEPAALRARMEQLCRLRGIRPPVVDSDQQAIMRCTDPSWWRRNLRKVHGRTFEAAAIRLGFVSVRAGAYASDETVSRRMAQVARNKAALESVKMENEHGAEYTLAELANKGTSNKRIRRGELMLRLAGCEEVANEAGHVGVFITLTAPSKYHAVLQQSGAVNPRYNDSTPRQVQAYLQKTWARIRAAYGRYNIKPYGFRIAEPHHDGCVHWHALVFMRAAEVDWFCCLVEKYALAEDGDEPGAQANRVKFERIDATKGSAAAYIAKYISKNIDDDSEDAHDEVTGADGEVVKIAMPSDGPTKASQRVDAWAGVWGIRQFQPIGQPPVSVWRELRRVSEDEVRYAPEHLRMAWDACQRVERTDHETGEVTVERPANYANYIRAQGGVSVGRRYAIGIMFKPARIEGRYGVYDGAAPLGVYVRTAPDIVYGSTRYQWTRKHAGVELRSPWSPVNNCTDRPWPTRPQPESAWFTNAPEPEPVATFDDCWFSSDEFQHVRLDPSEQLRLLEEAATAAYEQEARSLAIQQRKKRGYVGTKTQGFGA